VDRSKIIARQPYMGPYHFGVYHENEALIDLGVQSKVTSQCITRGEQKERAVYSDCGPGASHAPEGW
jgi:hypothetical protein